MDCACEMTREERADAALAVKTRLRLVLLMAWHAFWRNPGIEILLWVSEPRRHWDRCARMARPLALLRAGLWPIDSDGDCLGCGEYRGEMAISMTQQMHVMDRGGL